MVSPELVESFPVAFRCLTHRYVSDFSFNAPLTVDLDGNPTKLPPANTESPTATDIVLGDTSNNLATGSTLFTDGPWAAFSHVSGWEDTITADSMPVLTINARTFSNQSYGDGDADFKAIVSGEVFVNGLSSRIEKEFPAVRCTSDTYTVSYRNASNAESLLNKAGDYQISVVSGELNWHVSGSPHAMKITPAATDPASSVALLNGGNGFLQLVAGASLVATVAAFDKYGNEQQQGNDYFLAKFTKKGSNNLLYGTRLQTSDALRGQYSESLTMEQAGIFTVTIALRTAGAEHEVSIAAQDCNPPRAYIVLVMFRVTIPALKALSQKYVNLITLHITMT